MLKRRFALALTMGLMTTLTTTSWAQIRFDKPITLVVPNPPGGLVDTSARLLGDPLAKAIGQSVVIENKGGASGNIAYSQVARAQPDGNTLLISYSAYHVGNPSMFSKLSWSQKDFVPVALLTVATNVISAHPSVEANNLKDFMGLLKANPGKLNYASQGIGSLSHVGTELLLVNTNTEMLHVPYRGSGAAIADVLAGQVQVFITTPPSVMQHVQSGKLKAYAVTGKTRHPGLPNVPTTAEAGMPDFVVEAWVGLFAPAGTPPAAVQALSEKVKLALATSEAKAMADRTGIEIRYMDPTSLGNLVTKDTEYWGNVIKAKNIKAD